MLELYKNIRRLRKEKGITQAELAKLTGYSDKSMIAKIEKGLIDLPQTKIEIFAKALDVSPMDLMGWKESEPENGIQKAVAILDQLVENSRVEMVEEYIGCHSSKISVIPLFGNIACGEPIFADNNIESHIICSKDLHADFALTCKGDSMIDARIFDGDIVYIKEQPEVESGEIAAVLIDDEATLKRVYYQKNKIILKPENKDYEPLVFVGEEILDVRILGKAVYFLSKVR